MTDEPTPLLTFCIDGRAYAQREWAVVPRIGDKVLLRDTDENPTADRPLVAFKVIDICWGQEEASTRLKRQLVHVEVRRK